MQFIKYNLSIFIVWFKYLFLKTPIEIKKIRLIEKFYTINKREQKLLNKIKKINK